MAGDWVESRDGAFQDQARQLIAIIASRQAVWGLNEADLRWLSLRQEEFEAALSEQAQQAALYHAIVAQKQGKRAELERELRSVVRRINNHPGMTEELRKSMGLASPTRPARSDGKCNEQDKNHR